MQISAHGHNTMGKNTCQSKKKRKQNKHLHYIIINTEA